MTHYKLTAEQAYRLYNSGYTHWHHDTVEGVYIPIAQADMDSYHSEEVLEMVNALPPLPAEGEAADRFGVIYRMAEAQIVMAKMYKAIEGGEWWTVEGFWREAMRFIAAPSRLSQLELTRPLADAAPTAQPAATATTITREIGKKTFQPKRINWS